MRRIAVWASLCLFLLGSALAKVHAQQISIAGDINSPEMSMDISLRDADLNEVLTAMFNTTGGKYQLQVGNGVVGRIPRLQLIQTPFDKTLDAILGTEYSYTRRQIGNGNYLYTISGRGSSTVPDTGATVPTMAPPTTSSSPGPSADSSMLGSTSSTSPAGASSTSPPTLLTITQKKAGTGKAGDAATTETLVINSIKINNLDIEALCAAIGGTAVKLFVQNSTGGSGAPAAPTANNNNNNNSTSNNNNNSNSNNNNGYNNNGYNNNGNSNNNNNNNSNSNSYNNNSNRNTSTSTYSNSSSITSGIR